MNFKSSFGIDEFIRRNNKFMLNFDRLRNYFTAYHYYH